jgi:hypothetical protein
MASSRRLPLSYNVRTYGASGLGRDFTSLVAWEAYTDINLVTAKKGEVLECYDDADSFDDYVVLAGATTNASYFRVIKPADGEGHDGTFNNGVKFSGTGIWKIDENYDGIYDLIIESSSTSFVFDNDGDYLKIVGMLVDGTTTSNNQFMTRGQYCNLINCIAINGADRADGFHNETSVTNVYYNCNAINCGRDGFVDATCVNCISYGNVGNDWVNGTQTTCLDSGDTVNFVDADGGDFHLTETNPDARGNGTDLSADPTYAFDDDIDGDTRTGDWDRGFDQYATPAGDPNPPTTPYPANGGTGLVEDQELKCVVTDPDGFDMDVSFYNADGDVLIGTVEGVASGGIAEIVWEGLTPGVEYTWYAIADNGSGTAQSSNWTFTAGEENAWQNLDTNDSWRFYSLGYKILEWTNAVLNFNRRLTYPGTFADIYVADGSTAQTIANGTDYTKLTGFASDGQSSNCTADASNDKITITKTGRYLVNASISGSAAIVSTFKFACFLDGSEQSQCHAHRKFATANDMGSCSISGIIDVETENLDLDLRARHDFGTDVDFTPTYMNLCVTYLGET